MKIDPELSEPFEQFLNPIRDDLAVASRVKHTNPERLLIRSKMRSATSMNTLDVALRVTLFKLTRTVQIFLNLIVRVRTFWWS